MSSFVAIPEPTAPPTPPPTPKELSASRALQAEQDIIDWTERVYEQATEDRDRTKEVQETFRIIDYLEGKQWATSARRARSRPVLNKVRRHFWENVGLLTDLSLDFQVKLFDRLNDFNDFEKLLNELSIHWAMRNRFEDNLYDIILYGLLHTGPSKIQWNPALNGGMGDIDMVPIAPWQWAVLGAGSNPQDAECVMYFPVVTKDYLIRKFGDTAKRVECDMEYSASNLQGHFNRPAHISKESWNRMGRALQTSLGIKQNASANESPYPMVTQKEFWFRDSSKNETGRTVIVGPADRDGKPRVNWAYRVEPGEPLYPRGRVLVTAGGCLLEDQPNPYWHSKFPFPIFRPFRVPWRLSGDPMMRPWMQMNNIINRILGGMQDYLNAVIEPTLIAPKGAMPPADWDALDPGAAGGKIKFNNNASKPPEFMKKAEFPIAAAYQYITMVEKEFDSNSGSSAMQSALQKKQVPGEGSLETILSARSLPVRVESRSLASYLEEGGTMVVADMLQFYTVGHRVNILGKSGFSSSDFTPFYGQGLPQGMKPEEYVRKFSGVIKRDTMLQSQRDARKQIAMALSKLGKLSDRNLFRELDINFDYEGNLKELIAEAKIKLMLAAAAAAAQGKGPKK